MAILIGIDEAGFGPILGPLTVSAVAFELPREKLSENMWQILNCSVSQTKKSLAGRLLICDSKKAYDRKAGLGHLQRTVLAFLNAIDKKLIPQTVKEAIETLCPDCSYRLVNYPWYAHSHKALVNTDSADISIATEAVKKDLHNNQMQLLSIKGFCFDVGHYNDMVEKVRNKSSVLFTSICTHIYEALKKWGNDDLQIVVDRQGGRSYYNKPLQKMFPDMNLEIIKEDEKISSYHLTNGDKGMKIHFVVKADVKYLPVSLASMTSKYIRELLIERLNAYFLEQHSDLKPTAGYWKDGTRFIKELRQKVGKFQFSEKLLIRSR